MCFILFISLLQCLMDPLSYLANQYPVLLPWKWCHWTIKLNGHLCLVYRLRMCGALIPQFLHPFMARCYLYHVKAMKFWMNEKVLHNAHCTILMHISLPFSFNTSTLVTGNCPSCKYILPTQIMASGDSATCQNI